MERTINERLARLEKTNRLLVIACSILVALPVLAAVTAFQDPTDDIPEVVRAEGFELVVDGKVEAELKPGMGGGQLSLMDRDGEVAISVAPFPQGGGVITIMSKEDDGPTLALVSNARGLQLSMQNARDGLYFMLGATEGRAGLMFGRSDGTEEEVDDPGTFGELFTNADGISLVLSEEGETVFRAPESSED
ncbi:MAG: hypothetical protein IH944_05325 [Armatimonadetes bacterium]|nr:hypothetical protein [Armatimonadota bacterium]